VFLFFVPAGTVFVRRSHPVQTAGAPRGSRKNAAEYSAGSPVVFLARQQGKGATMRTEAIRAVAISAALAAGCAGVKRMDVSDARIVTLAELRAGGEELAKDLGEGEALVIRIAEGETVPLGLVAKLPFLEIDPGENTVVFTRETWIRIGRSGVLVSPDGANWAAVHEPDAIKELYGAEQGSLRIGLHASEERGPKIDVAVTLE
jgi:hypothetical protein